MHDLWTPIAGRVRRLHREAQGERLPVAAHRGDRARGQARSRCRSAPRRCTSTPSTASPRTGATRRARAGPPRPQFDEKIAWLRQVLAWRDEVADAGEWLTESRQPRSTTRSTCSRRRARWSTCPRARRRSTSPTTAHRPRPPLPRREGGRADGAARPPRSRTASASRSLTAKQGGPSRDWLNPELRLPRQPARARQGAPVVQAPAARGDRGAGPRRRREGARRATARPSPTSRSSRPSSASASPTSCSPRWRATRSTCGSCRSPSARPGPRARGRGRGVGRRGAHARKPRQRLRRRHPHRRRGPADDPARALLQAGAARSDRRLRHARQGRHRSTARSARTSRGLAASSPSG